MRPAIDGRAVLAGQPRRGVGRAARSSSSGVERAARDEHRRVSTMSWLVAPRCTWPPPAADRARSALTSGTTGLPTVGRLRAERAAS